jgi:hypothetical protein
MLETEFLKLEQNYKIVQDSTTMYKILKCSMHVLTLKGGSLMLFEIDEQATSFVSI